MDDFSKLIAPAKLADDNRVGQYYTVVIESDDKQEQVISLLAVSQDDAYERVMDAWENQDIAKC